MGVHGWKRIIAITVLIAFIGTGMAWATDQSSPQFQEQEAKPGQKKKKKFPVLAVIGGAVVIGAGIYFLTQKKDPVIDTSKLPKDVKLVLYTYNLGKGSMGSYTINTKTMGSTQITPDGMNLSDVDKSIFIVRVKNNGLVFGKYKGSTSNGALSLYISNTDAPNGVIEYDMLFPNTSNGVDYQGLEKYVHPGAMLMFTTIRHVDRGQTGDESVLISAVNRVNWAMNPFGIKYGEIVWVSASSSSELECGFGAGPINSDGYHMDNYWCVNNRPPPDTYSNQAMTAVGIAEHFELINGTDNIYGRPSLMSLQQGGVVTLKGADIIAYFAARNSN